MNSTSRHPAARSRLTAVLTATALGLGALAAAPAPAFAHEGHDHGTDPVVTDPGGDHGDPTDPGTPDPGDTGEGAGALDWSNYERVLLTKNVGEPIDLACSPTSAFCTPPATAKYASPTRPRASPA